MVIPKNRENLHHMEYVKLESHIQVVSGKIGADYPSSRQLSDQ